MALTSMFAKLWKLGTSWHVLCYCVRLLACGCMFSLVSRFSRHSMCSFLYHEGYWMLRTANAGLRKPGYKANNFHVSCHGGFVASGF